MREDDIAFGKLAIARGLVTREAVSECFRSSSSTGRSLRDELVARRLLDPAHASDIAATLSGISPTDGDSSAKTIAPARSNLPATTPSAATGSRDGLPSPGDLVSSYRVVSLLGKGGMGAVYRARDERTGVEVAVKLVLDPDPKFVARFERELQAVAKLRHPNVVAVKSSGTFGPRNLPYAVFDFVPGIDLSKRLKNGKLEPARAFSLVSKIARAVHHAHENKVLHRDLKPANILLRSPDEEPFVSDFGLARDEERERLTKTGEVLGTPAYMAPEQAEGRTKEQDARTDVYALGAILYECLVGEAPFKAATNFQLLKKVLLDDPVDPSKRVAGVPRDAGVVALKCLSKERDHRYATALEVAQELDRLASGEPILARPIGRREALRRRYHRRRTWYRAWAIAFALALAVVGSAASMGLWLSHVRGLQSREHENELALKVASLERQLVDMGLPLEVAPETSLVALDTAGRAVDELARLVDQGGGVVPSSARTCRRWLALLRDPSKPQPKSDVPLDLVLDASAALASGESGRARFATALGALPDKRKAERGALEAWQGLSSQPGVRSVKLLVDLESNVLACEGEVRAAWSPALERAWLKVVGAACQGTPVGEVGELAKSLDQLLGRDAKLRLPRLRASLVDRVGSSPPGALVHLLGDRAPTRDEQRHVITLVLLLDPDLEARLEGATAFRQRVGELVAALDPVVAGVIEKANAHAEKSDSLDTAAFDAIDRLDDLMRITTIAPRSQKAYLELFQFAGLDKHIRPLTLARFAAPILSWGILPNISSVPFTTDELADVPDQVEKTRANDPAALLTAKLLILLAAKSNTDKIEASSDPGQHAREHAAGLRAQDYVLGKMGFCKRVEAALAARTDPRGRKLYAIDRLAWSDALAQGQVPGIPDDHVATLRAEIAAVELACDHGHPHLDEALLALADRHRALAIRLHEKGDETAADAEITAAIHAAHEAWDASERIDAEIRRLSALDDLASQEKVLEYNIQGYYGTTNLTAGIRAKPFWIEADALRDRMDWEPREAPAKADFRHRAIAALERGLALSERSHMHHMEAALLLEADGRIDDALAHAEAAVPRPDEEGVNPSVRESIREFRDRLREVVAKNRK